MLYLCDEAQRLGMCPVGALQHNHGVGTAPAGKEEAEVRGHGREDTQAHEHAQQYFN